jgi:hypothetical protein
MRLPLLLLLSAACSTAPLHVEPWPEAERLFLEDPDWRGADAAYAIPLGAHRTLWLFGDTFVARTAGAAAGRAGCAMVRNSIGVQTGDDPATARMQFAWRRSAAGPADWIPPDGKVWHWPLHGLCTGDAVILFCTRVAADPDPKSLGFRAVGWDAFRLGNLTAPPEQWTCERLPLPASVPFPVVVGTAVVADGDHVHAFALREPGDHAAFLLRWTAADFAAGNLRLPEWRDGDHWVPHDRLAAAPKPVLGEGAPEFTVHRDRRNGFLMLQTLGFPRADVVARTAPDLAGPWSAPRQLFHPPQSDRSGVLTYAGKGLQLPDGSYLLTYASNAQDFAQLVADPSLYHPHCLRLWP